VQVIAAIREVHAQMQISTGELEGGIARVILDGRLDIQGAQEIDLEMNVIAGRHKAVLYDLQKLSFIGSMGLRTLIIPAQAIRGRGGKVVLFAPNEMVEKVLRASSIETLIPIHHELQTAIAALQ
jgi:anti-anti-sigma factor